MDDHEGFDPRAMLLVLVEHDVEFVLIGGLAATLYGSPHVTTHVDISPASSPANLDRLSAALVVLQARIRVEGVPEGLPFDPAPSLLSRVSILNLTTRFGDLDLTFQPSGTSGYRDLIQSAISLDIGDVRVVVASLEDVIRSKEAADREKDRLTLPTLRRLKERLHRDS